MSRRALSVALAFHLAAVGQLTAQEYPSTPSVPDLPPQTLVTFFPPVPLPFGVVVTANSTAASFINGRPLTAPEELADFVGEIFYPQLGTRLYEKEVSKKMEARLDAYRSNRSALLNELAEKLAETQILDATDRERELRAFAEQQSPRVLALEQEAERLRGDLIKGSLLTSSIEWNITRSWRLGEAALANDPVKIDAEFRVARAAAFYEDGLGLEQRGLMRELSIELERSARAARRRPQAADDYPRAMFFSPETARLQLPTDRLPAGLVAKIGSFNRDKTILKDELRATMSAVDNLSAAKRAARFKELTEKQWPRVCALESQAEEIRRELAGVAGPPPPWLPPISPDLRQRIDTYAHERNQVLADYSEAQRRARSEVKFPTELFRRTPAERERMLRDLEQRMRDAGATASKEFERVNAERITALHERYEILRAELAVLAAATKDPKTGQPMTVQSLLTAYRVSNQHFDAVGREEVIYANYRIAMMQPGLSPAQRRLLFTAAHAGLAQPLPAGEYTRGQQARPSAVY